MGLIFNGNGDVIKAVDGSLTVEGLDLGGSTNIEAGIGTFSGNLNVGGVLTYEDVKNVDSVGIVTARDHIKITTDNKSLYLGASDDFQLFHNGSHNIIKSNNGNLYLQDADYIEIGDPSGKVSIGCVPSGATNLRHNGSTKIATTSSGATVTGDITISDKIIHDGDTNTAIRFPTNDVISFERGGGEALRITTANAILTAGVTAEPLYPHYTTARKIQAEIKGALDVGQTRHHGSIAVNCTNSNSFIGLVRSDNTQTDGTGIGVLGWSGFDGTDYHQAAAIEVVKGAGAGNDDQPGHMIFKTNSGTTSAAERLRINSSGQVSIGNNPTVAADAALHIELDGTREYLRLEGDGGTSNAYIELEAPNNRRKAIIFKSGGTRRGVIGVGDSDEATDATSLFFSASSNIAGNSPHMIITSAGAVVTGGTTAQASDAVTLMPDGEVTAAGFYFSNNIGSPMNSDGIRRHTTGTICIDTASTERLRINSSGQVLIGTTTVGAASYGDTLTIASSTSAGMTIRSGTSNYSSIYFADGTSGDDRKRGLIEYYHASANNMRFYTDAQERLRITSGGLFGFNNTTPDGKGIDVSHGRTNGYGATSDHRSLAHIIARNPSDAPGRFASISLVNGGGTQAEGSINLVQTANYTGDITFKSRTGATSWTEKLRIKSGGQLCLGTTSGPGQIGLYLGDGTNPAGHIYANGTHHMYILANAYHDGAWKYLGNGEAQSLSIADGEFNFHTAGNNTSGAGNGVSWQTRLTISSNQNIYIWGNETGNNRAILYNGSGYFGIYGSSSNSVARQLRFHTGGGSASERMRLSSDGFLLLNCQDTGFSSGYTDMTIGNTSTSNTGLTIASSASNGYSRLHFADGTSGAARYAGFIAYAHGTDELLLGTGNSGSSKLTLTSDGYLNIPNQPAFKASGTLSFTDWNSYEYCTWGTENYDNAGAWNGYSFTCPTGAAGDYLFQVEFLAPAAADNGNDNYILFALFIGTSGQNLWRQDWASGTNRNASFSGMVLQLAAGDVVRVAFHKSYGRPYVSGYTSITGCKIN